MERAEVQVNAIAGIEVALHALCQPLTVLRCKLELGMLNGEEEVMREAMVDGVQECRRLNSAVETMRALIQQAMEDTDGNGGRR